MCEASGDEIGSKRHRTNPVIEERLVGALARSEAGTVSFRAECVGHARTWSSAREAAAENDDDEDSFSAYIYDSTIPADMFRGKMVSYRGSGSMGSSLLFRFNLCFETAITEVVIHMWGVYFEVDNVGLRERQLAVEAFDGQPGIVEKRLEASALASDHQPRDCELRVRFQGPTTAFRLVAVDSALCIRSRGRIRCTVNRAQPAPNDLARDLGSMLDEAVYSDLTLAVGDRTFKVLRAIVCARSPAMRAQLALGREAEESVVAIHDADPDAFLVFLRWCYTGQLDLQRPNTHLVLATLALADKFLVPSLVSLCADELMTLVEDPGAGNVALHCLQLIYNLPSADHNKTLHKLRLLCLDHVSTHFTDFASRDPASLERFVQKAPAAIIQICLRLAKTHSTTGRLSTLFGRDHGEARHHDDHDDDDDEGASHAGAG